MTMKITLEDFLGTEDIPAPSPDEIASTMALDFEASVFCKLKELGLKQKDIALRLGVSPATISKALSSSSNMTFKTAARIAAALDCDVRSPILKPSIRASLGTPTAWRLSVNASETSQTETCYRTFGEDDATIDESYRRLCAQNTFSKTSKSNMESSAQQGRLLGEAA